MNMAPLRFGYTNWRGEYAVREAFPISVEYRESEWHGQGKFWIMKATDAEKQAERDFLIVDMEPENAKAIRGALVEALEAVAADAVGIGRGENAISDATRALVEAALAMIAECSK